MAYDESFVSQPYETIEYILEKKRHFQAQIHIAHWQLRNLISSPSPNILNYVSYRNIYRLDTTTNTQTLLTTLDFVPRCTASGHGYICAGGEEHGLLAVVEVEKKSDAADVDDQLPLFGEARSQPLPEATVRHENVGLSIINSINIYKFEGNKSEDIEDDVVAVLTNNDKTVRILSLTQGVETAVMEVAFCVNHATVSPDGHTLVAVGDHQQAYFFERIPINSHGDTKLTTPKYASSQCKWMLLNIIKLHAPRTPGVSGYFSSAWSHNGKLCAVASESGYITLLDVDLVKDEKSSDEAIINVISSSRPDSEPGPGSVRVLQFLPDPWDMLVWSEGRGRICVGDLRYELNAVQKLHLGPDEPGCESIRPETTNPSSVPTVTLEDERSLFLRQIRRGSYRDVIVDSPPPLDHRQRSGSISSRTRNRSGSINSRRRLFTAIRNDRSDLAAHNNSDDMDGLEVDERTILEMLRVATQPTTPGSGPRSIRYRSNELPPRRSGAAGDDPTPDIDIVAAGRRYELYNDAITTLQRYRTETRGEASHIPASWRRPAHEASSTTLARESASNRWADIAGLPSNPDNDAASRRSSAGFPATRSSLSQSIPASHLDPPSPSPQNHHPATSHPTAAADTSSAPHSATTSRRLRHATSRESRLRDAHSLSRNAQHLLTILSTRSRADGHQSAGQLTAGLVVSEDGTRIWAGAENGIWEFSLNVRGRMCKVGWEAR